VTEQPGPQPDPGQQPAPQPDDAGDRTQEFSASPGEPAGGWAGWQHPYGQIPPPPPPPLPTGQWAYESPGDWAYQHSAYQPSAYQPSARDLAWPRRQRSRRPWLIVGSAAALAVAAVIGGFAGHAIDGKTVASGSPAGSGSVPGIGGNGTGGNGTGGSGTGGSGTGGNGTGNPFGGSGNGFNGGYPGSFGGSGSSGSQNSQGSGPSDAASIAARVDPGLVDVNTTVDYGAAQAAGTGMVLTSNGEVLTNNHVIEGATTISVTDVGNGKTYAATVVGYSVTKDVAVLQLTGASGLQTITEGSPASTGEQVVGIGNAGGTGGTPSYAGGTVTATGQSITASDEISGSSEHLTGMIETNADIESGDSGGPLVNAAGQVVGMDTAGSSTFQFGSQSGGTGYAIPIGTATSVAAQIKAGHASSAVHIGSTAFLGVSLSGSGSGSGSGFGNSAPANGVEIGGTVSGSPAAGSGLAEGDVITAVDGHSVSSDTALQTVMVNDVRPGERVTVQYTDTSGQQHSVSVVLASGPPA
jgi:S1-C subfamily serine protease